MSRTDKTDFSKKHGPNVQLNPKIEGEITQRAKDGKIPCAVAFDIAGALNVPVTDVGMTIDLMNYRITKCQLGLFGYSPEKKITKPSETINPEIQAKIEEGMVENRLSCQTAWEIARQMSIGKMTISNACETLKIKIKPCQLGAF